MDYSRLRPYVESVESIVSSAQEAFDDLCNIATQALEELKDFLEASEDADQTGAVETDDISLDTMYNYLRDNTNEDHKRALSTKEARERLMMHPGSIENSYRFWLAMNKTEEQG